MKFLVAFIVVLCLGIVYVVSAQVFTPVPEGSICTPDGQTIDVEAIKMRQLFWGIAIFVPLITLFASACAIILNKEDTRGERIGSYVFFASVIALIIALALCGG